MARVQVVNPTPLLNKIDDAPFGITQIQWLEI